MMWHDSGRMDSNLGFVFISYWNCRDKALGFVFVGPWVVEEGEVESGED